MQGAEGGVEHDPEEGHQQGSVVGVSGAGSDLGGIAVMETLRRGVRSAESQREEVAGGCEVPGHETRVRFADGLIERQLGTGGLEGLEQFDGERGLVAEDVCDEQHQALIGDIPVAALRKSRVLALEHIDEAECLAVSEQAVDAEDAFVPL